jgi:two-component system, NarL family, response regulator
MSEGSLTTILIVDDHFVARIGIREFLNAQPGMKVVAEAKGGEEAITAYKEHKPTVVLMDVRMPGLDGVRATMAIRHFDEAARILMVSSYDKQGDVQRAQEAGALGYITKEADPSELLRAVQTIAKGQRYLSQQVSQLLGLAAELEPLSPRELRILEMISSGRSNREIAEQMNLTPGTMRVYVHQILGKMGVTNRAAAVSAAIRAGLISGTK